MKNKIINAYVDGDSTYVTKETKYGTFTGKVTVADEDKDVQTELDGYTFAETKCDIQTLKERAKLFKQRYLGIKHAYNVLVKSGIPANDKTLKKLERQVKIAEREMNNAKQLYLETQETFKLYVDNTIAKRREYKAFKKYIKAS